MNKQRSIIAATATLAGALILGATAGIAGPRMAHGGDVDARVAGMAERLQLSDDQQQQLRSVFDAQQAERERLRADTRRQIDDLLTDEQRALRDQAMETRMERRLERMSARLGLDDAQQAEIRTLMQARLADPTLTREEMRERIGMVLTQEQQARLSERRGGGFQRMRCDGHR